MTLLNKCVNFWCHNKVHIVMSVQPTHIVANFTPETPTTIYLHLVPNCFTKVTRTVFVEEVKF